MRLEQLLHDLNIAQPGHLHDIIIILLLLGLRRLISREGAHFHITVQLWGGGGGFGGWLTGSSRRAAFEGRRDHQRVLRRPLVVFLGRGSGGEVEDDAIEGLRAGRREGRERKEVNYKMLYMTSH